MTFLLGFQPTRADAKTCSSRCRKRAYRRLSVTKTVTGNVRFVGCFRRQAWLDLITTEFNAVAKRELPLSAISGQRLFATHVQLDEIDKPLRKGPPNQLRDILIAETAIRNGLILVSGDGNLRTVTIKFGGRAIDSEQFMLATGH